MAGTNQVQALLKRHLDISRQEFLIYWEKEHAPKVVPWALKYGVDNYAQIHIMRLAAGASSSMPDLDISEWDGSLEMYFSDPATFMAGLSDPYYLNVILPDEKRFLIDGAKDHYLVVAAGIIEGERKAIIKDGKSLIDCEKEMVIWREWEEKKGNAL